MDYLKLALWVLITLTALSALGYAVNVYHYGTNSNSPNNITITDTVIGNMLTDGTLHIKDGKIYDALAITSSVIGATIISDGTVSITSGDISGATGVHSAQYYGSGDAQGITDSVSYWLCTAADCATKCQVTITDGLITGCS